MIWNNGTPVTKTSINRVNDRQIEIIQINMNVS